MTNRKISRAIRILGFIICIILLCSCRKQLQSNQHEFAKEYEKYGGEMLVIGLENDTEPTANGVVYLNSIDENLNIQFANLTDNKSEYILKLFLDYNEIDYVLDGEIRSEYIFSANAGETFIFPITLSNDIPFDTSHILTVAILTAPEKHAYSIDLMSNSYGVVMSYELTNKAHQRKIVANAELDKPLDYLLLSYQGIMLNDDFCAENNTLVKFPPSKIVVNPKETVNLAYRAGNYETSNDMVLIVLVDWKQQAVNEKPFLYIENKQGYISYGMIDFIAPAQAGEYEVTAFVVDDPYSLKCSDNFHLHDTAYRFTLIVEP